MPAETYHDKLMTPRPGEIVDDKTGLILPPERNVRESISLEEIQERNQKQAEERQQKVDNNSNLSPFDKFVLGIDTLKPTKGLESQPATTETLTKVLEQMVTDMQARDELIGKLQKQLEELTAQIAELKVEKTQAPGLATAPEQGEIQSPDQAQNTDLASDPNKNKPQTPEKPTTDLADLNKDKKDEKGNEKADGGDFEFVINEELLKNLDGARDRYAQATAEERNSFAAHLLYGSKRLAAIPGLRSLADKINESNEEKSLGPARQAYKDALLAIQQDVKAQYYAGFVDDGEGNEWLKEEIRMKAMDFAIQSEAKLEAKIFGLRTEESGKATKFINWWVKQEGLGGNIKKALAVGVAGAAASGLVALAGAPMVVGGLIGGSVSAGIGGYVSKKRASGLIGGAKEVAKEQMEEDVRRKRIYAEEQKLVKDGDYKDGVDGLIGYTEDRTAKEVQGNRARVLKAALVGGSVGSATAGGVELARSLATNEAEPVRSLADLSGGEEAPAEQSPASETPPAPELQGATFDVEAGNGYTHELIDFAQANGHDLSPQQSFELHQELVNNFGPDYIDIGTPGNDTYTQAGGDTLLAESGSAAWSDGVGTYIQQWMANRGLW